jgi:hypothetical protein
MKGKKDKCFSTAFVVFSRALSRALSFSCSLALSIEVDERMSLVL